MFLAYYVRLLMYVFLALGSRQGILIELLLLFIFVIEQEAEEGRCHEGKEEGRSSRADAVRDSPDEVEAEAREGQGGAEEKEGEEAEEGAQQIRMISTCSALVIFLFFFNLNLVLC